MYIPRSSGAASTHRWMILTSLLITSPAWAGTEIPLPTTVSCNQICGAEQCIGAYDDDMQRPCTMTTELPCTETLSDGVCLCSL